jgi:two-component system chemotaxis response regulator CheB
LLPKLRLLKLQKSFLLPEKPQVLPKRFPPVRRQECEIIAIASSTGGPNALNVILPALVTNTDISILIVQHMPPLFTKQFALSLDQKLSYTVCEATTAMLSPRIRSLLLRNYHMIVRQLGKDRRIALHQGPLENGCRPSADVSFDLSQKFMAKKRSESF